MGFTFALSWRIRTTEGRALAICVPIPNVLIELEKLTVEFPSALGTVAAVREISLSLDAGESLALLGDSGSGKSVTALDIMGLLPPQESCSPSRATTRKSNRQPTRPEPQRRQNN